MLTEHSYHETHAIGEDIRDCARDIDLFPMNRSCWLGMLMRVESRMIIRMEIQPSTLEISDKYI